MSEHSMITGLVPLVSGETIDDHIMVTGWYSYHEPVYEIASLSPPFTKGHHYITYDRHYDFGLPNDMVTVEVDPSTLRVLGS
jgi:hypothetical protein